MLVLVINENEVILIQFEFDLPPLTMTSLIEALLILYIQRDFRHFGQLCESRFGKFEK